MAVPFALRGSRHFTVPPPRFISGARVIPETPQMRATRGGVNYCLAADYSYATARKICSARLGSGASRKPRDISVAGWTVACSRRRATKRDVLKESPTPVTLSPASLELTRNYAITFLACEGRFLRLSFYAHAEPGVPGAGRLKIPRKDVSTANCAEIASSEKFHRLANFAHLVSSFDPSRFLPSSRSYPRA
ncbi:hypothetical protein KM043_017260 [Ampulex compressa]|nr:hypothetical protein KM043_017260 [Ampulex compressa]